MPKQLFQTIKFGDKRLDIIDQANAIIEEYQEQGFSLTLRQLYYQFVARGFIANKQTEYKRLGDIINNGRLAGLIDWDAIEDRTRNVRRTTTWDSPENIIGAVAAQYKLDPWKDQSWRPEVWIEKDALIGVIEPVCTDLRVPYFACRGYSSQSEQWRAGTRFRKQLREGTRPIILHLGDHDPSGIDMTRDNQERLSLFAGAEIEVRRLALNMDQVRRYNPPPNPAKESDSRHAGYSERFGDESWELDALDPKMIDQLIRDEIKELVDQEAWDAVLEQEREEKRKLRDLSERWDEIAEGLG